MSTTSSERPVETVRREPPPGLLAAYYELTKPGIAGFVAITAGVSYFVAAGGRPDLLPVLYTLVGTGLATGGALALNQYVEREVDGRMKRTRNRPLPSGRLRPGQALSFGVLLVGLGVALLAGTVGLLPAFITVVSAAAYIGVYTPLKSRSYLATLAGAVPGALPGLIGWSAATGGVEAGGWVLFGIYFLWQLPHVLALAWLLREDYQAVGFFLAPPSDPQGRRIGKHMVYHSISLLFLSLAPTLLGLTGVLYLGGAALLSLGMLGVAIVAARDMSLRRVRRVFLGSILYQPVLLLLLLLDTLPPPS
ncbi:MAG TPA: heme o synthase [Longimicrobiales bacterium]|nr:heme o synthase [Longimicrobiales bacterium]